MNTTKTSEGIGEHIKTLELDPLIFILNSITMTYVSPIINSSSNTHTNPTLTISQPLELTLVTYAKVATEQMILHA